MKNIESQFNTDIEQLISKLIKNYQLGAFQMPKRIQIYTIESPFTNLKTLQKLQSDSNQKVSNIMNEFRKDKYSYSSLFIQYNENDISEKLEKEYAKLNMFNKKLQHSFEQITFKVNKNDIITNNKEDHSDSMDRSETTIEEIRVPYRSIEKMDETIGKDIQQMDKNKQSYIIFVNFKQDTSAQYFQFKERMLNQNKDDDHEVLVPIGIVGNTLSAYLVSLFLLFIFFVGAYCLFSLQTPVTFTKTNFVVGRES